MTVLTNTIDASRYAYIRDDDHCREMLNHELFYAIADLEGHERLEWLRLDGEPVFDPHPFGPMLATGPISPHLKDHVRFRR
jgi:hypothetical protein